MTFILYSRGTSVTGRAVCDALGIPGGREGDRNRPEWLIRWGSSAGVPLRPSIGVLNSRVAVLAATDKLGSMRRFQEAHVPIPRVLTPDEARNFRGPVLGRKINHTQGRDIKLCLQREDVDRIMESEDRSDFFSEYIPTSREFRIHCFQGEVIKVSEKVLTQPENFQVSWIRNFDNGYTFRNPRPIGNHLQGMINSAALRAVECLELDFGAVDVILSDRGDVYVLEVNTGPSLSDNSLEAYVRKIARVIGIPDENIRLPNPENVDEVPEEELEEMMF